MSLLPDLERELSTLKDFQRRTVDYVFRRLYEDDPPAHRFLVADEVGLGKTLVARGVIARALHHLADHEEVDRIDIVYVCSNADIARQNLNRLNVTDREEIALPTRLTLLPTQLEAIEERDVNFVSLTPGTSLDTMKSRGGRKEERVLLYRVLEGRGDISRAGLRNLLQIGVHRENWLRYLKQMEFEVDPGIEARFLDALRSDRELWERLHEAADRCRWKTRRAAIPRELDRFRRSVVGDLRRLLAFECVETLEPDLIILDEFQRFRDLLDGEDEAARLTRKLLDYQEASGYRARVLLLSATPYRMLTLYGEEDEDHYADFLRTCEFLFDGSGARVEALKDDLGAYRDALFQFGRGEEEEDGNGTRRGRDAREGLEKARRAVERRLLSVMVRTERTAAGEARDDMLSEVRVPAPVEPPDLGHARMLDGVARAVEARDPVEYWKSAPYLLNLMSGYQMKERLEERTGEPAPDLLEPLLRGEDHLLSADRFEAYRKVDPGNGRLRALMSETVDAGHWRLLWMPPSLPYLEPRGAYAEHRDATKSLVFSAWRVVPEAVAALCSYEAERRMVAGEGSGEAGPDAEDGTGARSDPSGDRTPAYGRVHEVAGRPLDFTMRDGRPARMNPLMLLYPSPTLAELGDPLRLAMQLGGAGPADPAEALAEVEESVERRLSAIGVEPPFEGPGAVRESWYRVALARLDGRFHPRMEEWARDRDGWRGASDEEGGEGFEEHVARFARGFSGELPAGHAPEDLYRVLARLALASPAVCALRALRRVSGHADPADPDLLAGAVGVAHGLRSLFNRPEAVALLRQKGGPRDAPAEDEEGTRYWERVLRRAPPATCRRSSTSTSTASGNRWGSWTTNRRGRWRRSRGPSPEPSHSGPLGWGWTSSVPGPTSVGST